MNTDQQTTNMENMLSELIELREQLNQLGSINTIRNFINTSMVSEAEELKQNFLNDFRDIPKDNALRLEVLQTLTELGIVIYQQDIETPSSDEEDINHS